MTLADTLSSLLAAATALGNASRRWHDRGRHISLVPDNTGLGATLHTNHVAAFAEKADCALAVAAVNALPALLRIARAAEAFRTILPGENVAPKRAELIAALDAMREE